MGLSRKMIVLSHRIQMHAKRTKPKTTTTKIVAKQPTKIQLQFTQFDCFNYLT